MAKIRGGLHGRPSGNVSGIVYGAARTRTGKAVTARELVYPSNPRTADQVLQRNIFKESLYAVRHLTASLWQDTFNRSIGQLPGFHSMMSIILDNTDDSEEFNTPSDTPLGNLHFPETFATVTGAGLTKTIDISWTAELGLNGTTADLFRWFVVKKEADPDQKRYSLFSGISATRADTSATITILGAATVVQCACFIEGAGTADGLLSLCRWEEVTSQT